jgi:hypothetical protein
MIFKDNLSESEVDTDVKNFMENVENTYHKYFPNSLASVCIFSGLGKHISISCYLAKDRSEELHGYFENDMFNVSFMIDLTKDGKFPSTLVLESTKSSFSTKPSSPYLAYGYKKVPFRKTKGDAEKILKTLDKYFSVLKKSVKEELDNDNIHNLHIDLVKSKI